jgi:lipopolysaccharide transport system ATP-binding protein
MGDTAIRVDGLGKSYRIDHEARASYRTLRESLASFGARRFRGASNSTHETIWALKDVSFEVARGEALGIIGRNGAGKSTLLKILSRITRPTVGRAEIYGRLGSLLEVGTGFHPELTGRENIFLNGAILGMSRREIRRRFDEIVDFAETERFLDTPVKRYSTGMYMRLAFAVAAHLETDILVVDEVLAVGDAAFQQKCLGKMEEVAGQGRSVLFVSHNMAAITQLCTGALLLDGGTIAAAGPVDQVAAQYLASANPDALVDLATTRRVAGTGGALFEWAELRDSSGRISQDFSIGESLSVLFGLRLASDLPRATLAVVIRASDGTPIAHALDVDSGFMLGNDVAHRTISVTFADLRLYPGSYWVTLRAVNAANTEVFDLAEDCLTFRIIDGGRLTMRWLPRHTGLVFLTPDWRSLNGRPPVAPARRSATPNLGSIVVARIDSDNPASDAAGTRHEDGH